MQLLSRIGLAYLSTHLSYSLIYLFFGNENFYFILFFHYPLLPPDLILFFPSSFSVSTDNTTYLSFTDAVMK